MNRPIVVIDTETAALRGAPHLLELGAIRVEGGEIQDTFEEFVRPPVPIDPDATAIHGITDADVREADEAGDVLERFTTWAGSDWMCAHNAGFDARVLGFEYTRFGLPMPAGPFLDTLKLAKRHIPESPDHKLETLCQHLDLEEGVHHRALADAVWCWKVLEECADRAETNAAAELLGQCGSPVTIPGYVPGPPRLKPRLRPLATAVEDQVEITLLYGEDTGAPTRLHVLPRMLYERHKKSYLEAECVRTGTLKTYLLERIQKVV